MRSINWPGFGLVLVAAYLIPGPDLLIILRSSTRGWRAGLAAAVGAQSGLCVHLILAIIGLSVLLTRYPAALTVLQMGGALYLLYLGGRLVLTHDDESHAHTPGGTAFTQGLLTNLLNPKAVLFFASVLPQFVSTTGPVRAQVLALGVVDILFGFLPWALVIALGVRLAGWLDDPRHRRRWNRVSGALLIAVALFLLGTALVRGAA